MRRRLRFGRLRALASVLLLGCAAALADPIDDTRAAIASAAQAQVGATTSYDPSYRRLDYPLGDVPLSTGVCADVIVRALRGVGLDLQLLLHTDMKAAFSAYPSLWGLSRPDRNIDHRRVPNLRRWFERHGWSQPVSDVAADYRAGDIVSWRLDNGRPHIGIVSADKVAGGQRPLVVHNIAFGAQAEDVLFEWQITGRYRLPDTAKPAPAR